MMIIEKKTANFVELHYLFFSSIRTISLLFMVFHVIGPLNCFLREVLPILVNFQLLRKKYAIRDLHPSSNNYFV